MTKVSVVVPMYNEAGYIEDCLAGFASQTVDTFEVVVADGNSADGSRQTVDRLRGHYPWLRVVDNPARRIPAGCNAGVAAASGDVVCFFSAHGVPAPTFVERVLAVLDETGATGVGGVYHHEGVDRRSRAIGKAMASPIGMASPHRFARARCDVDTISHPAYRIDAVRGVGGFDETLQRNEDYELNWRLRAAGARLVFDPSIESTYRPRTGLRALGRQFFRYGRAKAVVVKKHPRSLRARHLVAPAAVAAAPVVAAVSLPAAAALGAAYVAIVAAVALRTSGVDRVAYASAFPVMHTMWGAGFLVGLVNGEA